MDSESLLAEGLARKDTSAGRSSSNNKAGTEAGEYTTTLGEERPIDYTWKEAFELTEKHPRRRFWPWLAILLILFVALGVANILRSRNHQQIWTDCGETPDEARSRGCSFDMLSHAWVPKQCYDHEISEAYGQAGPWQYYLDRYAKFPIDQKKVARGETDVWLRQSQHYVHCTYMWRQMHRAFTVLHHIDSHLDRYNHTLHCQKVFLEERDGDLLEVLARVIYPSCHPV